MSEVDTQTTESSTHGAHLSSDGDACYRALLSRDRRFDGRFFVGVSSTGIYCRPVCRVRCPKRSNCSFYSSAAAAEHAGYRPCLLCRPEQAPGWSTTDISEHLAHAAAHMMQTELHRQLPLNQIAERLGVSDRHLRRVFESSFGVKPIDYLQTRRRLMAKQLLADTSLSISRVAEAAGFGSTRRLNASLQQHYGLSPTEIRLGSRTARKASPETAYQPPIAGLSFELGYRKPYDFQQILTFLANRSIEGVEHVSDNSYSRILSMQICGAQKDEPGACVIHGWINVSQSEDGDAVCLSIDENLAPCIPAVIARVRHIFDLDADPEAYLPVLGKLAQSNPGIRLPGAADGFEVAVRAVLGQQITVKAARTLATRFVHKFGERIKDCPIPELRFAFPAPARVHRARINTIASLGIIRRRTDTIKALAGAIERKELDLSPAADAESTIKQLCDMPGIGPWTAHYLCMRALHWPDAFPAADYGVMKALAVDKPQHATKIADAWRPWRAYAVMQLWYSLK